MTMNKVYTIEEYIEQGFTAEEAPLARKADLLYNRRNEWTEKEESRYYAIVKKLGL